MTKTRLMMVLLVGVIALVMVAHVVIAADDEGEGERPRRGPGVRRGRGEGKPEGRGEGEGRRLRDGQRRPPRPSPLMIALDTNKDGKLSKTEIANATKVLQKLAGKDGELTREELRPKRPEGIRRRPGKAGEGRDRPE